MNNRHQEKERERERDVKVERRSLFHGHMLSLSFTVGSWLPTTPQHTHTHTQTLEETVKSNINK